MTQVATPFVVRVDRDGPIYARSTRHFCWVPWKGTAYRTTRGFASWREAVAFAHAIACVVTKKWWTPEGSSAWQKM